MLLAPARAHPLQRPRSAREDLRLLARRRLRLQGLWFWMWAAIAPAIRRYRLVHPVSTRADPYTRPVNIRRRKHWGWGFEDQQPTPARVREAAAGLAAHLRPALGDVALGEVESPVPLEALELARAAHRRAGGAGGASARPTITRAPRTRSASPTPTSSTAFAAGSSTLPTSSPARATRPTSSGCWSGARPSASPRSPTAGAHPSSAA